MKKIVVVIVVIAALALGTVSGMPILEAPQFANAAAGVVVGKHGTATATLEEVLASGYNFRGGAICGTSLLPSSCF